MDDTIILWYIVIVLCVFFFKQMSNLLPFGGMKAQQYKEIVQYLRLRKYPEYIDLDSNTVKNRKRALKRTCADFL